MPVLAHTGTRVAPGDTLFTSSATTPTASEDGVVSEVDVLPGEGCVVQYVEVLPHAFQNQHNGNNNNGSSSEGDASQVRRCIVATRQGVAQWDGRLISVFATAAPLSTAVSHSQNTTLQASSSLATSLGEKENSVCTTHATALRAAVMGPRPGDTVHLRVTRLNRLFAFGEIIAVNWRWCSHRSSTAVGASGGVFKGVLRLEDIRPFRPTKDQLQPPAPTLAFALGDVVLAEVISQSDAHQYQLSTVGEGFGVVESYISTSDEEQYSGRKRVKLQHIPGRRDAMMVPSTGGVVPRWCPLLS